MVGLDVILGVPDPARLDDLGRALFSAALQDQRPLAIQVACKQFDAAALEAVRQVVAPIQAIVPEVTVAVLNDGGSPASGLRAARGRYLAIMGCDDLVYPEGHRLLIAELQAAATAIAFAAILTTDVTRQGLVPITLTKRRAPRAADLRRLLLDGHAPAHGVVLDRSRIAPVDLAPLDLATVEDPDLLRLCARYGASFRLMDTIVGEHVVEAGDDAAVQRRTPDVLLGAAAQAQLGIDEPGLSLAAFLARSTDCG